MTEKECFGLLLSRLNQVSELQQDEINSVTPSFSFREYKKHDHLTRSGEIENYAYFIAEGCVRNYCVHNGIDYSLDFFFNAEFANSYMSFLTRQASIVDVECLTEVSALRIHYNALQKLYESSLVLNKIGRQITELLYIRRTKQDLALITKSAHERYYNLMTEQPELINNIPQKYLSTYLGITPETLSRLRNRDRQLV
jgi:CRP-like cAMP-binding protein